MSLTFDLPTDEELSGLAKLAASPQYRNLTDQLRQHSPAGQVEMVLEIANVDWFATNGFPVPAGAKINPRVFEDPNYPVPVSNLNKLSGRVRTILDSENPLNQIFAPPKVPIGVTPTPIDPGVLLAPNPEAITICGSIGGGGVIVTICGSVGT